MLQRVDHNPYGRDHLYNPGPTERLPRDPMAGDTVYIKVMTEPVEGFTLESGAVRNWHV